jgi:hypothetical protein
LDHISKESFGTRGTILAMFIEFDETSFLMGEHLVSWNHTVTLICKATGQKWPWRDQFSKPSREIIIFRAMKISLKTHDNEDDEDI